MASDDPRLEKLGQVIARLREELGWTQGQLADKTRADRSQISRLEAGERLVSAPVLARIAHALGTSTDDLLARAGYLAVPFPDGSDEDLARVRRLLEHYPALRALVNSWPHLRAELRDRLIDQWMFEQIRERISQMRREAALEEERRAAASRVGRRDADVDPAIAQAMEAAVREFETYIDSVYSEANDDATAPPGAAGAA